MPKTTATLTMHHVGTMTPTEIHSLVTWLRQQILLVKKSSKKFNKRFTATLYGESSIKKNTWSI